VAGSLDQHFAMCSDSTFLVNFKARATFQQKFEFEFNS
jgi:hypothetical protein